MLGGGGFDLQALLEMIRGGGGGGMGGGGQDPNMLRQRPGYAGDPERPTMAPGGGGYGKQPPVFSNQGSSPPQAPPMFRGTPQPPKVARNARLDLPPGMTFDEYRRGQPSHYGPGPGGTQPKPMPPSRPPMQPPQPQPDFQPIPGQTDPNMMTMEGRPGYNKVFRDGNWGWTPSQGPPSGGYGGGTPPQMAPPEWMPFGVGPGVDWRNLFPGMGMGGGYMQPPQPQQPPGGGIDWQRLMQMLQGRMGGGGFGGM